MTLAKAVMRRFYQRADGDPERLPWHRTNPDRMLIAAARRQDGRRGRALDVGCGAGVFSVYLANEGWQVTGIDLFDEAITMARAYAADAGVDIELLRTDLFDYAPDNPFDLVFDSGCLHSLVGGDVATYKRHLLRWLAPGGEYVLGHWGKRHALDWRPIGPRRRSEATIRRIFAPELELLDTEVQDGDVPLPFGPKVRAVGYRFRRTE
jgi:SAM-dependent methyltransferase